MNFGLSRIQNIELKIDTENLTKNNTFSPIYGNRKEKKKQAEVW